jgi:hypothetical protein
MLSYKETLFLSIINETLLTENYSYGDGNFLELLLEAPIPNNTVNKIIKNNKQVTFYYQGDDKLKRSWYPVQVISRKKVGSDNIIKAYVVPKDGSKPYIHDFDQSKIVNWNVLGTAPANLVAKNNASSETPPQKDKADAEKAITAPTTSNISAVVDSDKEMEPEFEKKVVSFMQNDSVPKEKKKSLLGKLKNIGVKLSKGLLKVAVAAGLFYGSLKTPGIDSYVRKLYPNVTQLISPKDLTNKDFRKRITAPRSEKTKKLLSEIGKKRTGSKCAFYGRKHTEYSKKLIGESSKQRTGKRNPNYKHGNYIRRERDYKINEITILRKMCFERDNYTCHYCEIKGKELHAHHIIPFWFNKEAFNDLSNLITVCVNCHFIKAHQSNWQKFDITLISENLINKYSLDRERLNELAAKADAKV